MKYVYTFKEGNKDMRNLLGGKGANLAEMTNLGLPIPEGFTITTEACTNYYENGKEISEEIQEQVFSALEELEKVKGKKFGDINDPLLVSVRSGARASMPGMMDTILNLGLNDVAVEGFAKKTNNPRFAYDSYRRFIQMYSDVVMEVGKKYFEELIDEMKTKKNVKQDIELDADIEILNPNQEIATIVEGGSLNMEMTVGTGRGYTVADENKKMFEGDKTKVNTIAIDSIYSPVERINYEVENARVGQNNNYDKLILEVWTNGSILPEEALALASRIIIEHFEVLTKLNEIADETGLMVSKNEDPSVKILETSIDDLDFSVRAYNCLKRANILTLKDLVDKSENEMMKIRNLGKKSLKEVIDKIKEMGLKFRDED